MSGEEKTKRRAPGPAQSGRNPGPAQPGRRADKSEATASDKMEQMAASTGGQQGARPKRSVKKR